MIRTTWTLLIAAALVLAPFARVQAHDGEHHGDDAPISIGNPYKLIMEESRKAYEDAYRRYQEAARQAYWSWSHYQAYYRAYYDLYSAYGKYAYYYRLYHWHESQRIRFAGVVCEDDGHRHIIGHACPPLAGATVQLTTYAPPGTRIAVRIIGTKTTDAHGRFQFTGLEQQKYSYHVTKPGYSTASGSIDARPGSAPVEIKIRKNRGIEGVVLARPLYGILPVDPPAHFFDPRPLVGAKVTVYRTDLVYIQPYPGIVAPGPDRTAYTDGQGRFSFPDVDFGSARVVIEKHNYRAHTENVDLSHHGANLRVVLEYSGPPPPVARPADPSHDDIHHH